MKRFGKFSKVTSLMMVGLAMAFVIGAIVYVIYADIPTSEKFYFSLIPVAIIISLIGAAMRIIKTKVDDTHMDDVDFH